MVCEFYLLWVGSLKTICFAVCGCLILVFCFVYFNWCYMLRIVWLTCCGCCRCLFGVCPDLFLVEYVL